MITKPKSPETLLHTETDAVMKLYKQLNLLLREHYGSHKPKGKDYKLSLDDNWTMMGKRVAGFTNIAIYFYERTTRVVSIRTSKGALWVEYHVTGLHNGKRIRKGYSDQIRTRRELANILEWITEEKDILCENADLWEYADEFHLWTFQT
jgi:hypothetical protein